MTSAFARQSADRGREMAPILVKDVVVFSSEDSRYPALNIVNGQKWLTDPKDTSGKAVIELQLDKASKIQFIDIGYTNVASLEICVGRSSWPSSQKYAVILPTVMLHTPMEARAAKNKIGCRMFNFPEHLNSEYANERWDRVRINLSQPFSKNKQMGLEFIRLGSGRNTAGEGGKGASQVAASSSTGLDLWRNSPLARLATPNANKTQEIDDLENKLLRISSTTEDGSRNRNSLSRTAKMVLSSRSGNLNTNRQLKLNSSPKTHPTDNLQKLFPSPHSTKMLKTAESQENSFPHLRTVQIDVHVHPEPIHSPNNSEPNVSNSSDSVTRDKRTLTPQPLKSTKHTEATVKRRSLGGVCMPPRNSSTTNSPISSPLNPKITNNGAIGPLSKSIYPRSLEITENGGISPCTKRSGSISSLQNSKIPQNGNPKMSLIGANYLPTKTSSSTNCPISSPQSSKMTKNGFGSSPKAPTNSKSSPYTFKSTVSNGSGRTDDACGDEASFSKEKDSCSTEEPELSKSEIKRMKQLIQQFFNTMDMEAIDPDNITLRELRMAFEAVNDVQLSKDGRQHFKSVTTDFLELAMTVRQHKERERSRSSSVEVGTPARKRKSHENTTSLHSPIAHTAERGIRSPAKVRRISQDIVGTSAGQHCEIITVESTGTGKNVQCPICMRFFHQDIISDHAAVCGEDDAMADVEILNDDIQITSVRSGSGPRTLPDETYFDMSDNMGLSEEERRHWTNFSKKPKPYHPRLDKNLFHGCQLIKCPSCGQYYKSQEIEEHSDECAEKVNSGLEKRGLYYVRKDETLVKQKR